MSTEVEARTADEILGGIRQRDRAATPGPWRWYGNADRADFSLATTGWGGQFVMRFARAGMQNAQPVFAEGRIWEPNPQSEWDFKLSGLLTAARDLAIYEVAPDATSRKDKRVYRADIAGIRNPDAEFIASARQDVHLLLRAVEAALSVCQDTDGGWLEPEANIPAGEVVRLVMEALDGGAS